MNCTCYSHTGSHEPWCATVVYARPTTADILRALVARRASAEECYAAMKTAAWLLDKLQEGTTP